MGENALSQDVAKTQPRPGDPLELTICGVKAVFRYCPPGTFLMGSPESEKGRLSREIQREVTLARGFWLLETPITQALWTAVMRRNPRRFRGSDARPVEKISWNDCSVFVAALNSNGAAPDEIAFDFPTEAEWEYACRAGTTTAYNVGAKLTDEDANFDCGIGETTPVKSFPPNAWGLYDTHGNVFEWVVDKHGYYSAEATTDPVNLSNSSTRVMRGGSWRYRTRDCRSACRNFSTPPYRNDDVGFRLCVRINAPARDALVRQCSLRMR